MALVSTTTKAKTAGKTAKVLATRPAVTSLGWRITKPAAKRAARGRARAVGQRARSAGQGAWSTAGSVGQGARSVAGPAGQTARSAGATAAWTAKVAAIYVPIAMEEFGLIETPKPKSPVPPVAAGIVIGAAAMYFLEPGHGSEHRQQVMKRFG